VQRRVDGVVVAAVDVSDRQLEPLRKAGAAVVTVGAPGHGTFTDVVSSDDERIAADAVAYLYDQGHRHLGIVSGPPRSAPGAGRLHGYREALRSHGLRPLRATEAAGTGLGSPAPRRWPRCWNSPAGPPPCSAPTT